MKGTRQTLGVLSAKLDLRTPALTVSRDDQVAGCPENSWLGGGCDGERAGRRARALAGAGGRLVAARDLQI